MMYQAYQLHSDVMAPLRFMAAHGGSALGARSTAQSSLRRVSAASEVFARMKLTHKRPAYGIDSVQVANEPVPVSEERVLTLPFGTLLHFRKPSLNGAPTQPPVLLVAPLSGHFATLLRETARTLLQDHDVYITDWHNARDVSLQHGAFSLDDYIDYMIRFMHRIGPGAHIVAVCQPCVAALAATALMSEDDDPAQPRSLTLMAGPVDCRINPTAVNTLATSKPMSWFEKNLISRVPLPHMGFGRRVYPGFVQLTAFMSMNLERHKKSFRDMYQLLVNDEIDKADAIRTFYDEYFAVNDLPAEFYLETVEKVFQTYDLAMGNLHYRGRRVNAAAIRRTALMTVEGERDDICAVGQTMAAQELCSNVKTFRRAHHIQTGVGHYGVFSGSRWNQQIYPRVREMIYVSAA
ncbi:MAG: polyhydroxyalkanoate depolymerase [Burkholderiales bacterium]|nr:polyhydroxyalkanoate depolymerase [Burkholderiales bacterium]